MNQNKALPIDVTSLRAKDYTPDGKKVIIPLTTRLSTEHAYSVPVDCLYDLIADLQKLNSAKGINPNKQLEDPISRPKPDLNRVNVTVPKKWMLRSGLPNHPFVIMILDPQTEEKVGYALSATATQEMAIGLVKYADSVAKHEATKRKLS